MTYIVETFLLYVIIVTSSTEQEEAIFKAYIPYAAGHDFLHLWKVIRPSRQKMYINPGKLSLNIHNTSIIKKNIFFLEIFWHKNLLLYEMTAGSAKEFNFRDWGEKR